MNYLHIFGGKFSYYLHLRGANVPVNKSNGLSCLSRLNKNSEDMVFGVDYFFCIYSSILSLSILNFSMSFSTVIALRSSPESSMAILPFFIKIVLLP